MRRVARDPTRAQLERPADGRELTVRSADGTLLHAEQFGPEEGETVVLVHGWTENLSVWTHVIRELAADGSRVVALDLRGHGKSQPAREGDYSITRYGEDVQAALEQCLPGDRRALIAGHSLGAMSIVAWAEQADVGHRIKAAALINTGFGDLSTEHLLVPVPGLARTINKVVPAGRVLGARGPLPRFSTPISYAVIRYVAFGRAATPAQVAFYERMLAVCPPRARASTGVALAELELHDALAQLAVPTLVLAGEKDRLTPPSHARRVAELLPDLHQLIVLEDTGHMAPLERPREVCDALRELTDRVRNPSAVAA